MSTVLKAIELPERVFSSKEELFKALHESKSNLVAIKKATVKDSDGILIGIDEAKTEGLKAVNVPKDSILAVINTTKYLDSHNDVHINGIWDKSINEQQGKIFYVADHNMSLLSVVAYPKDVEMKLLNVSWKDLGADYEGKTQALSFLVKKENVVLDEAKRAIEKKVDIQHSIRMQYVKYELAMDSSNEDHTHEKAVWDKYIGEIANKEKAIEQGYFWAVEEAKIFKEGSMVLAGSNDITPMLLSNKIEPEKSTHTTEPPKGTQKTIHNKFLF